MKKIIAILFIMMLSCETTLAGTVVTKFNNAGRISGHQYGAGIYQKFGRNAIYSPQTNRMLIQANRQRRYEEALINSLNRPCCNRRPITMANNSPQVTTSPSSTESQVSRFDKSYTIQTPKTYTKGGVTYYN